VGIKGLNVKPLII